MGTKRRQYALDNPIHTKTKEGLMPFIKLRKKIKQEESAYLKDLIASGIDIKTLFERQGVTNDEEQKQQAGVPNMKAVRKAIKAIEMQNKHFRLSDYKESAEVKLDKEKKKLLNAR